MSELVRFLSFPELRARCGIRYSRMHIDRLEKKGEFPLRVPLGRNSVAWVESEVIAWQQAKITARVSQPLAGGAGEQPEPGANPLVVH